MNKIVTTAVLLTMMAKLSFAGNPDRRGEAGAPELNMNGYARSSGFWNLNCAGIKGLEAERLNPAGLAYTRGTEIIASYTSWLSGAGVNIVQGGFATRFKGNAVALTINSINFGSIDKTTTDQPEPGQGVFKPTFLNIGLGYAKNFSLGSNKVMGDNVITGGVAIRLVSEIIGNVTATGFAFDAGLQYTTGKKENVHFGVSLRNIGTPMKFTGDDLSYIGTNANGISQSYFKKTGKFELPTQLNIGVSYDWYIGRKIELEPGKFTQNHRLTFLGQYSANAFGNDNWGLGLEYSLKEIFMLRAAYRFENGIFGSDSRKTAYTGLAAGASVNIPFKKDKTGPMLSLDYAIRPTATENNFTHTHTVGVRFSLGAGKQKEAKDEATASAVAPAEEKAEKKKGKKAKVHAEELEERDAKIDSLTKIYEVMRVKAETPIIKTDTVTVIKKEVVIQKDTILVPTTMEKTDYKGGFVDTVTKDGKRGLQFNDYDALEFETGSAKIQTKSYSYLNYLVNVMKKNPSYKVVFDGHTDNVGSPEKNRQLSQDRVEAVKNYFVSKGIGAGRVVTNAYGETKPKYANDTEYHKAKNRRVEIFMEM